MSGFATLGLSEALVELLGRMQITIPTPIQQAAIPFALNGRDILASAQTGSGKTVAYSVPLLVKLSTNPRHCALILAPTRELATQVQQMLMRLLGNQSSFRTALLIGGASMSKQIGDLKRRPQLIIGTPGRIYDHLERGSLVLNEMRFLVIDEADRMLDMGFGIQLERIAEYLPQTRQTLMFSATLPPNIVRLSQKYLREPERISIDSCVKPAAKIKQEVLRVGPGEKKSQLLKQLEEREGSIIVFVKTKRNADRLSKELYQIGHNCDTIHGDLPQRRRERVILSFRNRKTRILVATDVAARGLDIPHVMHVINYDLPQCPEDYIHRIGRTGRAEAEGNALSLVSSEDNQKWRAISRFMDPENNSETPSSRPPSKFQQRKREFRRSRFRHSSNKQKRFS